MSTLSNSPSRKLLLRIPKKLSGVLSKTKSGDKINVKICQAVEKFYLEVVPDDFKRAYTQGLSPREMIFWPQLARRAGFFPSVESPTKQRVCFGTILTIEILDRLKAIATWGGTSRQSAVDASIAYFFQIPGAPNPDRGQFSRFTYPMLSGTTRLTRHRLRWLVEYGHV